MTTYHSDELGRVTIPESELPPQLESVRLEIVNLRQQNADLLAALKGLTEAILEGPGALPRTVPEWQRWEPIVQARATIARAEQ